MFDSALTTGRLSSRPPPCLPQGYLHPVSGLTNSARTRPSLVFDAISSIQLGILVHIQVTMDNSGYNLLLRFIDSQHFTLFLCISYLARYTDNIGVHFHLCQKLRTFSYLEIEFFLPQLCQIILTVPTESVALEDFLLEMCNRSTHSAVQVCHRRLTTD